MISAPPIPATVRSYQQQAVQPVASAPTCSCGKTFNLQVQRGATLSSKITLTVTDKTTGVKSPIDLTGQTFLFTAKPHQDDGSILDDADPRTIKINWQETVTSIQGVTWLTIPSGTTENMEDVPYDQQCWMVSSGGVVTPLFTGSLVITEPVSARST